MNTVYFIIEFIGTLAFAISGIRLASAKHFDWFGGYVVGLATAIGGGTIRDVMLGLTPFWMTTPIYLICTAGALLLVIIFKKRLTSLTNTWFLFDTLGLALFTIAGIQKTLFAGFPFWVAVIMGCMTGAAGGIIRDVLINEVPLIFRKEIYALACIIGGIVYWIGYSLNWHDEITMILSFVSVIIVRVLAAKYHISLPILRDDNEKSN
ncbi:MAG: trimeric intracellular cation channel family protein [Prevotella sp.]|nr:trimeric intracellular cation channel family protein [Prevotella sp.]MBQ4633111.1 trimeric intracellular cation channel family protein [Prevotella sp.]MBQ5605880.1 trimeric intracellular cation channel family protein [Prevotella sp.]